MTGTLTLSLEIELAWGWHDIESGGQYLTQNRDKETQILQRLISTCDELKIPISFDVVGHLLLEECSGDHTGDYPEGWFAADPGTDFRVDPQYYAPDLLKLIDNAATEHEICTHTFSHILCNQITENALRTELRRVAELHQEFGIEMPKSIVTPRHRSVPRSVLRDNGIQVIRVPLAKHNRPNNPIKEYVDSFVQSPPIATPSMGDCDLLETYCTPYPSLTAPYLPNGQAAIHPSYRIIPSAIRRRLHERYLQRSLNSVIGRDSYLHHWSHLYNMANDEQWPPIRSFLESIAERRESGEIRVRKMEELYHEFEQH